MEFETHAIRAQLERTHYHEHSAPVFLSSSFVFDSAEDMRAAFADEQEAFIYSRYTNPNTDELIEKMCLLEGAEAGVALATGMAAIYTSMAALLQQGDHVLSCASVFGATHTIFNKYFPKFGLSYTYFPAEATERDIEAMVQPNTRILFLETPTNPALEVIDLEMMGRIAQKKGLIFMVDNCFATPWLQQPIQFGADVVIHSATKYIDGQGRVLGGVAVGKTELIREIYLFSRITGPAMSPFNAWVLSKSLETLAIRMERHCENALFIAEQLQDHPALERVKYPFLPDHPQFEIAKKQMKGGGGIVTLQLKEGYQAAQKMMDALQMIRISPNLGDARSIATHPASSTHCKLSEAERAAVGIHPGLIRISVGLENKNDILADIRRALADGSDVQRLNLVSTH